MQLLKPDPVSTHSSTALTQLFGQLAQIELRSPCADTHGVEATVT